MPFIEYICQFRKSIPCLQALLTMKKYQKQSADRKQKINIALLHCILNYPTNDENANLGMLLDLKKYPNYIIGYSDHTSLMI